MRVYSFTKASKLLSVASWPITVCCMFGRVAVDGVLLCVLALLHALLGSESTHINSTDVGSMSASILWSVRAAADGIECRLYVWCVVITALVSLW